MTPTHSDGVSSTTRPALTLPPILLHFTNMADVFSKRKRSQIMAAIRSHGNKDTELKLATILRTYHITGWRRQQPLPGKPDFVFPKQRLAVFVDGCFWHGCPKHGRKPDTNRRYWLPKLLRNKKRDQTVSRQLRAAGWRVLRIWAHRLSNPEAVAARLISELSFSSERCHHRWGRHERSKRQN